MRSHEINLCISFQIKGSSWFQAHQLHVTYFNAQEAIDSGANLLPAALHALASVKTTVVLGIEHRVYIYMS